ncbi:hypothetical protein [Kribbella sp. NPDC004536]|uniref:hypothetical protein n=1 Tax=Kribbella sp. NPDC004536 TaxID=3364106 RepID=UPI003689B2CE
MPTALERATTAAVLAVRRDPSAARAVEQCRHELAEPTPDGQQAALLVGWAYLALHNPSQAWECFRAAVSYATHQHLTDRAALLAGLLAAQRLDAPALAGAWYRVSTDLRGVLDRTNFTGDLSAELTDQQIWPDHAELHANILPTLLTTFDARSRSLAALTLYALHHANGQPGGAVQAAKQVVQLAHPTYVAAAWLGIAETLVKQGDNTAAAGACEEALAADGQYSARLLLGLAEGPEPDVHTQAGTLLGTLQRDVGDLDSAVATLTAAARDEDPTALLALAQTHDLAGDPAAAQPLYTRLAEHELSEQYQDAVFNLGLQAKDRRDLPEATRWFRRYIEAGYAAHPLAAAHLGELAYWVGDKQAALHWYQYTLDHTELPMLVEEAEQRIAELRG